MCTRLEPASRLDANAGTLYALCGLAVAHVMELGGIQLPPETEPDPDRPRTPHSPLVKLHPRGQALTSVPNQTGPGANLYAAFCAEAKTLLIENQYFDLDRRSEIAELQEYAFESLQMSSMRMHFFSVQARPEESLRKFVQRVAEAQTRKGTAVPGPGQSDATGAISEPVTESFSPQDESVKDTSAPKPPAYLGYSVVRGQEGAPIGRTLVSPYATATTDDGNVKVDAHVVYSQVRTAVTEHVSVFGVTLMATGVPFMEQDGALLRCGHVSAWMCHYTAVLRGFVPRRPVAHFHRAGQAYGTGRSFPSSGVTVPEIAQMLGKSDLPPEVLDAAVLTRPRPVNWTDRQIHHERFVAEPEIDPQAPLESIRRAATRRRRAWIAENLGASVCRYLNSGIPSILLRHDDEDHTQVVVGYLRRSDLEPAEAETARIDLNEVPTSEAEDLADLMADPTPSSTQVDEQSDVLYLIVADDQRGPFVLVEVEELAQGVDVDDSKIMVPMPRSVSMTGQTAERTAVRLMGLYVDIQASMIRSYGGALTPQEEGLLNFSEDLATASSNRARTEDPDKPGLGSQKYTIRTYVTTGVDLKAGVNTRLGVRFAGLTDALTMQSLPKFVWVLEVIDRKRRRARKRDTVRAMLVLDASQVTSGSLDDDTLMVTVRPMFLHIPGSALIYDLETIGSMWIPGTYQAYSTGRWDHNQLMAGAAERVAIHGKGSVALT